MLQKLLDLVEAELRLDQDEFADCVHGSALEHLDVAQLQKIKRRAAGWIAGLQILSLVALRKSNAKRPMDDCVRYICDRRTLGCIKPKIRNSVYPSGVAEHRFIPTRYYNTIGSHEPAFSIDSGDTVVISTLDAWGQDEEVRHAASEPNPMSGPIYVRGAERGDTLAVHIDRITPNRRMGWVRTPLAYNVVDPDYVREIPVRSTALGHFDVDMNAGTVTLTTPNPRIGGLVLPARPMIGCFGVAPDGGEAISTATSGPYGGNMDYNGFTAGVTVYFPVFADGALFHLGDVHARQGDGEISGTGIEISAEVAFTATVIRGKAIGTVRGEDETHIFTVGNARPLDQAVQHATTEMARWLAADYGLDGHAIGVLMGQCVRYDLGNIFDPAYTMVCRMPKAVLSKIAGAESPGSG